MTLFTRLKIRHALRKSIKRMRRLGVEECRVSFPYRADIEFSHPIPFNEAVSAAKLLVKAFPLAPIILIPATPPKEIIV